MNDLEKISSLSEGIENIEIAYKLLEFSIRQLTYLEQNEIDYDIFGSDLIIDFGNRKAIYKAGEFTAKERIVSLAQINVLAAFGATAVCINCETENLEFSESSLHSISKITNAVRNAFSHNMANPRWHVKPHKIEDIDLGVVGGPLVSLSELNGKTFEYEQIGGFEVWIRIKNKIIQNLYSLIRSIETEK